MEARRPVQKMVDLKAKPLTLRVCSLLAVALLSSHVLAFKSEKSLVTIAPAAPLAPFPFPNYGFGLTTPRSDSSDWEFNMKLPAKYTSNGGHRYVFSILREAQFGTDSFDSQRPFLQGLYRCPDSAHEGSLDGCVPLTSTSVASIPYPWVAARRSWNAAGSEHLTLTQAAANAAGLPASLGVPFFVRYPGQNVRLISRFNESIPTLGFIAGQSFIPTSMAKASAFVLRGISLYELSEVPDMALSVQDWAAGDEICPLNDIDGAYQSEPGQPSHDPGQKMCHDFFGALGSLNSTHFAPGSRYVYEYYHRLALQMIRTCNDLQPLQAFYTHTGPWAAVQSAGDTEVHECEREAFVFEMFAQHFLQDAWSSGHMWHAWGHESFSQFPPFLEPLKGASWDDASPPSENLQGRRALIAGAVGAFRGMVHGDRDVALQAMKENQYGQHVPDTLLELVAEDPLSAPFFGRTKTFAGLLGFDRERVTWLNANGTRAPGAGDQYLNLLLNPFADFLTYPDESLGDTYVESRNRLLMCTATSLREVYEAGPQAHGAPSAFSGAWPRTGFDFRNECWTQRATNASMYGSVAPVRVTYDPYFVGLDTRLTNPAALFGMVNKTLLPRVAGMMRLPNAADRAKFVTRLEHRMTLDATRVTMDYAWNLINPHGNGANGIESAIGTSGREGEDENGGAQTINFLGVPPSSDLPNSPPLPYSDLPTPTVSEDVAPEQFVTQHMFWRSHIKDICAQTDLLQKLRDRCVAGASEPGGDPDACTACAQVAELHMPPLWYGDSDLEPSKCDVLGYPGGGGLPESLLNFQDRYTDGSFANQVVRDANSTGVPPYFLAVDYCTDTIPHPGDYLEAGWAWDPSHDGQGKLAHTRVSATVTWTEPFACDPLNAASTTYPESVQFRHGIISNEFMNIPNLWAPPLVTALDEKVNNVVTDPYAVCNGGITLTTTNGHLVGVGSAAGWFQLWGALGVQSQSNLDIIAQHSIGSAPLFDSAYMGSYALSRRNYDDYFSTVIDGYVSHRFAPRNIPENEALEFGSCGLIQRVSYHNRSCAEALAGIGREDLIPLIGAGRQEGTGAEVIESSAPQEPYSDGGAVPDAPRCSVRQPREVIGCAAGECNAEGLCTSRGKPTVQRFHDPVP